jgi:hypothetical protein
VRTALAVLLCAGCLVCGRAENPSLPFKVAHLPPTSKDVIEAVLAHSQLPLTDPSCKAVGTEPADKTIGRYLAGFLAELSNQDARNAVTTSIESLSEAGEVYLCRFMIRHVQGEDVWSWGVEFAVRKSDGAVVADSFRCIGAG